MQMVHASLGRRGLSHVRRGYIDSLTTSQMNERMATQTRKTHRTTDTGDGTVDDTAAQVLRQFRQVLNAIKTHFQQVEKTVGLGGAQLWALSVVRGQPGVGVVDLARAMDIHQSTASNLVKVLIERGLVTAAKEGTDRRAVQLRLLPAGAKVLKSAPEPFTGVLPSALASLDQATLKRLRKDLALLLGALKADKKSARIPLADL
jgi:DNA-binding MarR family transcriptional regulator